MDDKEFVELLEKVAEMKDNMELLARKVLIHEKKIKVLGEDYEDRVINANNIAKEVESVLYG